MPTLVSQDTSGTVVDAEKHMGHLLQDYMAGSNVEFTELIEAIKRPLFAQRMLERLQEIAENDIHVYSYEQDNGSIVACVKSYAVLDYIMGILGKKYHYRITSKVYNAVEYGAPQKRERFIVVGLAENVSKDFVAPIPEFLSNQRTVHDAISDLADIPTSTRMTTQGIPLPHRDDLSDLAKQLRGSMLYNHICTDSQSVAQERFASLKEGQNFHDLDASLKTTYSNAARTQNTIYMRLNYTLPSGTVVNVRKSVWIHPVLDRAISIREAARLQTFPDSYIFEGTKDAQYQQVGNAVPPILATAIAKQLIKALSE